MFVVFSAACAASQDTTQLIIFRAFQGAGGAGCFALGNVIILELVPPSKYTKYVTIVSLTFTISSILGPIIGGAISEGSTWRWIFLLNIPAGLPAAVVLIFAMPDGFPRTTQTRASHLSEPNPKLKLLKRIDYIGVCLVLLSSLSLTAALEEVGLAFGWKSAFVISLITISCLLWLATAAWSFYSSKLQRSMEPIFPWRFATNRVYMALLLTTFLLGPSLSVSAYQIPARYQVIYGLTPLDAGLRLIAFTGTGVVGSVGSSVLAKKGVPPIYMLQAGAIMQVIAFSFLGTLGSGTTLQSSEYALLVIAGIGFGQNFSLVGLITPFVVDRHDIAAASGTVTQLRMIGGAVGVSIVTSAMNSYVSSSLSTVLSQERIKDILSSPGSIANLDLDLEGDVRLKLLQGYQLQLKILATLAGGQFLAATFMWKKEQIRANGKSS